VKIKKLVAIIAAAATITTAELVYYELIRYLIICTIHRTAALVLGAV